MRGGNQKQPHNKSAIILAYIYIKDLNLLHFFSGLKKRRALNEWIGTKKRIDKYDLFI